MKFYDLSQHNSGRYPDLRELDDADFFMIRAGIGLYADSYAAEYVEQCKGFRPWYPYWVPSPYWAAAPQVIRCLETIASLSSIEKPMPLACADLEIVKLAGVAYKPSKINKVWKEFVAGIGGLVSIYTAAWVMPYLRGEDINWMRAHPLHVASYRSGAPYMVGLPWKDWQAWQYTERPVDTNTGKDDFYSKLMGDPLVRLTVRQSAAVELLSLLPIDGLATSAQWEEALVGGLP